MLNASIAGLANAEARSNVLVQSQESEVAGLNYQPQYSAEPPGSESNRKLNKDFHGNRSPVELTSFMEFYNLFDR